MRIGIQVIHHRTQRYNTIGDWQWTEDGYLGIKVSRMHESGWRGEACVAVHELVEALLCKHARIDEAKVDAFDMNYDNMGAGCEPGDHPKCPYEHQHAIATAIERLLVDGLGLNWAMYEQELLAISEDYERKKRLPKQSGEPVPSTPDSTADREEIPEETP